MTAGLTRRGLLGVLSGALAAPLVARADSLMALRGYPLALRPDWCPPGFLPCDGRVVDARQYPELARHFRRCGWWLPGGELALPDLRSVMLSPPPPRVLGWPLDSPPPGPPLEVRHVVAVEELRRPNGVVTAPGWTTALQVRPWGR